jgi:hypothetical protein
MEGSNVALRRDEKVMAHEAKEKLECIKFVGGSCTRAQQGLGDVTLRNLALGVSMV